MYCHLRSLPASALEKLTADPDALAGMNGSALSLEKAWHALHFLLTGSAGEGDEPFNFLLQGGETLGDADEEEGDVAPRFFPPAAVQLIDEALTPLSEDELWGRFDPEQMEAEGVYPSIWDEDEEELKDEYLTYFRALKTFIHNASTGGKAVLIDIG
jgi:hypothetical protein